MISDDTEIPIVIIEEKALYKYMRIAYIKYDKNKHMKNAYAYLLYTRYYQGCMLILNSCYGGVIQCIEQKKTAKLANT